MLALSYHSAPNIRLTAPRREVSRKVKRNQMVWMINNYRVKATANANMRVDNIRVEMIKSCRYENSPRWSTCSCTSFVTEISAAPGGREIS